MSRFTVPFTWSVRSKEPSAALAGAACSPNTATMAKLATPKETDVNHCIAAPRRDSIDVKITRTGVRNQLWSSAAHLAADVVPRPLHPPHDRHGHRVIHIQIARTGRSVEVEGGVGGQPHFHIT